MISKMIFNLLCLLFGKIENIEEVTENDVLKFQRIFWIILLIIAIFVTVVRYVA